METLCPSVQSSGEAVRDELTLGGILRAFLPLLLHLLKLGAHKLRVLWQLAACGTPALGANLFHCPHCQHRHWAPRSCGNRHCPRCLAAKSWQWLEKQTRSLLPISYYHCVFTLPAELNSLILTNQRKLYPLLFDCAAQSLLEFGRNRLHGDLGITAVLHTWGQKLDFHPHLHCIVTGGALSPDGKQWRSPKHGEQLRKQRPDAWRECNQRLYEYYRTLALHLPDTFREMEPLLLAVVCGCNAGLFREALHEVYIPRIQRGNTSFAANVLGARGALLSVLVHFFEHGRWGSLLEIGVEEQGLTPEDRFFILIQTGEYLTATRGLGASEAGICYERAQSLCHSLNHPRLLYVALMGQWRYSLSTDKLSATMQIAQRVYFLAQEQNEPALMIGACAILSTTHYFSGNFENCGQYATSGAQLWRSGFLQSHVEDVDQHAINCLCQKALVEWHIGEITSSQVTIEEAIALAKGLYDMQGLAVALHWAATLAYLERNLAEVERLASDLIELSTRQSFAHWLAVGTIQRGWARSVSGDTAQGIPWIEDGIGHQRANGAILGLTRALTLKAEALYIANRTSEALETLREAEALAETRGERWWSAELHRLRGVFLTAIGADETQIEASFCAAISTAKQQKSISLAKCAEASYAKYRCQKSGV
jgi:predicted ATPase/predicted nucleic acid-binding Zn ribbon protein